MNRLHNACFAILNTETSFWVIENFGAIYKINSTAFIRTCASNFSSNNMKMCASSKIPTIY